MNTTSVRGTITSRTKVSPSSKTEWIILLSSDSITLEASARSTISRSSASDENGPSEKPLPGVIALPIRISSRGRGPSTRPRPSTAPADANEIASARCRPMVRGPTPTTTNNTTNIRPMAANTEAQRCGPITSSTIAVPSTTADVSVSRRSTSTALRLWAASSSTRSSRTAPGRCSWASSSARAREKDESAASTVVSTAASTTSATTSRIRPGLCPLISGSRPIGRDPVGLVGDPFAQELVLEAEHLLVLVGLGMVVAEQVQDAVHGEQVELGSGGVAGGLRLLLRDGRAQHQVAEHSLFGLLVDQARPQLVHREGEHVGRAVLVHPALVQLGDGVLVDRSHAQLGQRMHAHAVHHEPSQALGAELVDLDPGLVLHLDGHDRRSRSSRFSRDCWRASNSSYAATILPTSRCRTTSWAVSRLKLRSSTPSRISSTTRRPLFTPLGRSTWVTSPVTTICEPKPNRVRNIFICSGEVFCASSRMMNASFSERPRM